MTANGPNLVPEAGAPAFVSREKLSEGLHDALHKIAELHKRWDNRLTVDKPRFMHRYVEFELHILVRFFIGSPDKEFFACFEREKFVGRADEKAYGRDRNAAGPGRVAPHVGRYDGSNIDAIKSGTHRDNEAVLVDVVQTVEGPETTSLASRVWFERADRINSILPHSLYLSGKSGFEFFGALSNRKACLVPIPVRVPEPTRYSC